MAAAVILDVDGTLVDSNDAHARAWVGAFAAEGITVAFDAVRRAIGMGGDKLMPDLSGIASDSARGRRIEERRAEILRLREMLGDTPCDIAAAARAAVRMVAVESGGWARADLRGAVAVYADAAELLAHYDASPFAVAPAKAAAPGRLISPPSTLEYSFEIGGFRRAQPRPQIARPGEARRAPT